MNTRSLNTTVAGAVVEVLKQLEVEQVFGLPGIQNIELFDALADAIFPTFTPTNESAVVFMADAHARVTGKIGVAVVTTGPGLTNALTAIAEAKLDSSPVMILVGGGGTNERSFQLHQVPQDILTAPVVKGFFKPNTPEEVVGVILQAAKLARQGEPGPVVVELSPALLMERGRFTISAHSEPVVDAPDIERQLDEAAERLRRSPFVGIYAGAGAMDATDELRELAELLQAPVATTISGRGVLAEDHPCSVGYGFGRSGTATAWRLFRKIDTLLAVGCKYGETATGSYGIKPPTNHIHIDINPASLGVNFPTSLAIVSDAKIALVGLLARLDKNRRPPNRKLQDFILESRNRAESAALNAVVAATAVSPSKFLRLLRRRLDRDAILTTDSGSHQFWALNDFPVYSPRSFLAPADYQAMGFSIPAAIAAKLAFPQRQVVSLVGDGGFLMSGFECLNALRWKANITVMVFRDGAWGLIKESQKRLHLRTPYTDLPNLDMQILAKSFGVKFVRIANETDMEWKLSETIATDEPCLVEVNVDYSQPPPYVKGAGPQMFQNLPLRVKTAVGLRYIKRLVFPPGTKKP
ncbi:MAG: thiamine pyrophosphate-binding protein [Verrucomicrobiia bacterium]